MVHLPEIVERYLALAGSYGRPAPLAGFGMPREEVERIFSVYDEDYHISRFFHFSNVSGEMFQINGFPHTHVSIDPAIRDIL